MATVYCGADVFPHYAGVPFRESRPGSGLKRCSVCREELPPWEFYLHLDRKARRYYLSSICRVCGPEVSHRNYEKKMEGRPRRKPGRPRKERA